MFLRSAALSAMSGCLLIASVPPASADAFDWLSDAVNAVAGAATTVGNGIADAANAIDHEMRPGHYDPFKLIGREAMRGISYIPGASGLRPSAADLDEAGKKPQLGDEDGDQQQSGDTPDDATSKEVDAAGCGEVAVCDDPSAAGSDDVGAADPEEPNGVSAAPQTFGSKADDASANEDSADDDGPTADTGGDDESAADEADDGPSTDEPDDDGNDAGGDE